MTTSSDSEETKDIGYSFFLYRHGALKQAFTIPLNVPDASANPCAWDPLDLDALFTDALGLTCFLRACALPNTLEVGDAVTSWPDESGSGNDMSDISSTPVPVFDGSSVVFNRDAAGIQCQDAFTFHAPEWTWFFTCRCSHLSDTDSVDRLFLRVFSVDATLIPYAAGILGISWRDYRDNQQASGFGGGLTEAETGVPITAWLSRTIVCIRARVHTENDTKLWNTSLRINGSFIRSGGCAPYNDARRNIEIVWTPGVSGHVMTLKHVLGFDRYLDDAACASVESILSKYA